MKIVRLKDSLIYKTTLPVIILFTMVTGFVFYNFYQRSLEEGVFQATRNILSQMNIVRVIVETSQNLGEQQEIVSNLGTAEGVTTTALIEFKTGSILASSKNAFISKSSHIMNRVSPDFTKKLSTLENGHCTALNTTHYLCLTEAWAKPQSSAPGQRLKEELLHLVVIYDISDFLAAAKEAFLFNSLIGVIASLSLAIGLFFVLKKYVLNKLSQLLYITDRWSNGEKDIRIPVTSGDEIAFVATSLNSLMDSLREYEAKFATQQASVVHSAQLVALGEMAAGIAHEVNNPLTIISGKIQLLERSLPPDIKADERIKKSLETVVHTVQRISKIINALRAYARSSQNDNFEVTSVNQIIEDSLSLCQERFKSHGVIVKYEPKGGILISGKDIQLVQVLVNLLNNAFDAVLNLDQKWIRIETLTSMGQVQIMIIDSGEGISTELANKIMQPFFTTKPIGQGTGIGLSISKGIVEEHGGTLTIDTSRPNTCFVVTLPIKEIQQNSAA